ncbi:Uncharacterized protein OBRU01_02354 [Operophtera brumata]|uniref:Uncharacterized protein n=1 Tax=Operophtera brumata TaxID=104452 RepID=A0A0L7LSK9_OPEBR|nr:Uncharacterized protein OBRU01_02354 [Operophtera brumata]
MDVDDSAVDLSVRSLPPELSELRALTASGLTITPAQPPPHRRRHHHAVRHHHAGAPARLPAACHQDPAAQTAAARDELHSVSKQHRLRVSGRLGARCGLSY